jgi:hypothetical protein
LMALAGRSTTSPAAMRLTVSGGRRRIGIVGTLVGPGPALRHRNLTGHAWPGPTGEDRSS